MPTFDEAKARVTAILREIKQKSSQAKIRSLAAEGIQQMGFIVQQVVVPGVPLNFTVTPFDDDRLDLAWTANPVGPTPTKFELDVSLDGVSGWTPITLASALSTTYSHTGLDPLARRFYRVRALTGTAISGYTTANGTTLAAPDSGFQFPAGTTPQNVDATSPITAVPTFNNIGLYWNLPSGSLVNEAIVRYKKTTDTAWKQALSLPFDDRLGTADPLADEADNIVGLVPPPYGKQYRGSIVDLDSDSTYQIEVMTQAVGNRKIATASVATWNEVFPEGVVTTLPTSSTAELVLGQGAFPSGTAGAYRVYQAAVGGSTIDRNNGGNYAIRFATGAHHIILRNNGPSRITCRRTVEQSIGIDPDVHDIRIQRCDLREFGHKDPNTQYACNSVGGVGTTQSSSTGENFGIERIIVEDCEVHLPNFDSNAWGEVPQRPQDPTGQCGPATNDGHPAGATPFYFNNTGGLIILRYNHVYGDAAMTTVFDDGMGGAKNFSFQGGYPKDCDIYGNIFEYLWDDIMELDGAGINNRVYKNLTRFGLTSVSFSCISIGPTYFFRNVRSNGVRAPGDTGGEGVWMKVRSKPNLAAVEDTKLGQGHLFAINNTIYRLNTANSVQGPLQLDDGASKNIHLINNIITTESNLSTANRDRLNLNNNCEVDNNMYRPAHTVWAAVDDNGIFADPTYVTGGEITTFGTYAQQSSSAGVNAGKVVPNITDGFVGAAPDVGAQERGGEILTFGIRPL